MDQKKNRNLAYSRILVFMIFDFVLSGMTMIRYVERSEGVSAANELERTLDTYYDDDKMEQIYPNMQIVE